MRWLALVVMLICLTACGNVSRPLAYTSVNDPVWQLSPMPIGGNAFSAPPVPGAGRIRNGL